MSGKKYKKSQEDVAASFDTSGTEGMLDVILACTLIFILLTALVRADSGKSQEITLPPIDLTKARHKAGGASTVKKTVVSLKMTNNKPKIFLNNKEISFDDLKRELSKISGIGQVALRRDKTLPCEWEDKIILECRKAGIDRVAIIVASK